MRTLDEGMLQRIREAIDTRWEQAWAQLLEPGTLYLVGTPVGNLLDISPRVVTTLAQVDLLLAEDTRHTRILLSALGISNQMVAYHQHNEQAQTQRMIRRLQSGQTLALVTDAGMPAISDPGQVLCSACHTEGIPVRVIPGPSALPLAAAGSGLVKRGFSFMGFLPSAARERRQIRDRLIQQADPVLFYEAPHRLEKTLHQFKNWGLGSAPLCLCRELTKRYESYQQTTVEEALRSLAAGEWEARGEYVLVLDDPASAYRNTLLLAAQEEGRGTKADSAKAWQGSDRMEEVPTSILDQQEEITERCSSESSCNDQLLLAQAQAQTGNTQLLQQLVAKRFAELRSTGLRHKELSKKIALELNCSAREVYQWILEGAETPPML